MTFKFVKNKGSQLQIYNLPGRPLFRRIRNGIQILQGDNRRRYRMPSVQRSYLRDVQPPSPYQRNFCRPQRYARGKRRSSQKRYFSGKTIPGRALRTHDTLHFSQSGRVSEHSPRPRETRRDSYGRHRALHPRSSVANARFRKVRSYRTTVYRQP